MVVRRKEVKKKYNLKIFFFVFFGDFSWKGGGTLPKIVINLPMTYEKLHCKGNHNGSAVSDILWYIHIDTVTFIKGIMFYFNNDYND